MFAVGLLGARFRDLEPLLSSVVPILFFISPILYRADRIAPGFNLVWLNPFSYMIEAVRSPLLGFEPHEMTYSVLIGLFILGGGFSWVLNKMRGRRLAFWV
jgi:ABC-type polysaccharide/polyol phosphate export permease